MSSYQKVIIVGFAGDEPRTKYFEGGGCVCNIPIATSETYVKKATNEKVTKTEWHNIVIRGKMAEICDKYVSKGDRLCVDGKITYRKWTDDQGQERYVTEIVALNVTFLTSKAEKEAREAKNSQSLTRPQQQTPQPREKHAGDEFLEGSYTANDDDDDLPF